MRTTGTEEYSTLSDRSDRATVGAGSGHSGRGVFRNGVNFTWDSRDSWAQEGGSKARAEELRKNRGRLAVAQQGSTTPIMVWLRRWVATCKVAKRRPT